MRSFSKPTANLFHALRFKSVYGGAAPDASLHSSYGEAPWNARRSKPFPALISIQIGEDLGGIFFDALGNHHDCMSLVALGCGAQPLRDLACWYLELRR